MGALAVDQHDLPGDPPGVLGLVGGEEERRALLGADAAQRDVVDGDAVGHAGGVGLDAEAEPHGRLTVGIEVGESCTMTFYGSSFITDGTGGMVAEAGTEGEAVLTATFDLDELETARAAWGLFRDRRPELYLPVLTFDGKEPPG